MSIGPPRPFPKFSEPYKSLVNAESETLAQLEVLAVGDAVGNYVCLFIVRFLAMAKSLKWVSFHSMPLSQVDVLESEIQDIQILSTFWKG